ncbi:MAG: hypothetical protein HYY76_09690 [Acidobacteria bacterium]|nr:hypothetical protein [Acidobacteriota bacterium]
MDATIASAVVVTISSLAPVPPAGPISLASFVALVEAADGGAQALTVAGKPWNPPRTADGKPDLQGMWAATVGGHTFEEGGDPEAAIIQGDPAPSGERPKVIVDPTPDGRIPYQPWAEEKRNEHLRNIFAPTDRAHVEPEDRCLLNGVPRINLRGQMQIVQTPGYVLMLYEWIHAYRFIPLDGRPHVASNIRLWNGDSRGRWEGDTLVVDVTNFHVDAKNYNNQPWLDGHGSFYSDALHVVERWTLADANTISYEATITDPKVFTRSWKLAFTMVRNKDKNYEFLEVACYEGYKPELALGAGRALRAAGKTGIHEHAKGFYGGK